jgi:hypothetical protein
VFANFIVTMPRTGLRVIGVKGWYPNSIRRAADADGVISARGRREVGKGERPTRSHGGRRAAPCAEFPFPRPIAIGRILF